MNYRIKLTKTASASLKKLDKRYQRAVAKALDRLAEEPQLGLALKGKLRGYHRLRFSRYRIIYQIKHNQLLIIVIDIRHRRDIYRN